MKSGMRPTTVHDYNPDYNKIVDDTASGLSLKNQNRIMTTSSVKKLKIRTLQEAEDGGQILKNKRMSNVVTGPLGDQAVVTPNQTPLGNEEKYTSSENIPQKKSRNLEE